ncbi:hypothetical protein SAY87_002542 [Trapa incisa]|uniref:E2 ubiquitin-conjugating enzyme n=1 Tax=Trapa incisa TaxID=236973 RepID=A0AAN7JU90_9MYRT|nr:hypothetical protein SAY87_002542 [Trapa incisa]
MALKFVAMNFQGVVRMEAHSSESEWDSFSESSEEQEELEFLYENQADNLLSNLEETIGKIDEFLSFERGFLHGDIVCSAADPTGPSGKVVNVEMYVDIESTAGKVIRSVNTRKLAKIRSICAGDFVVHGHWLGRVNRVIDSVGVIFDDGERYDVIADDQEKIVPTSPTPVDDPQFSFYPGQRVWVKLSVVSRQVSCFCGSWKGSHEEGTVCAVKAGFVHVEWLGSALGSNHSNFHLPEELQDEKNVTLLPCFLHSSWQLGDWCSFSAVNDVPTYCKPGNGFASKDSTPNHEDIYVILRTRTRVDVMWQDGTFSIGVGAESLIPVNIVDVHEFWPEQFVLMKSGSEDSEDPMAQKWGVVRSMDGKEKTVKVDWKNAFAEEGNVLGEETMSAYELIDHPVYCFCHGDIVFRLANQSDTKINGINNMEKSYLSLIGYVVGIKDGAVEVKWATGITTKVAPFEICLYDKSEVSIYASLTFEETANQHSRQMVSHTEKSSDPKRKNLLNYYAVSNNNGQKYFWEDIPFSLSQSVIGFFTSLGTTLYCSMASKLELGLNQTYSVPEDRNPPQDHLDKKTSKTLSSGMDMNSLVVEEVNLRREISVEVVEDGGQFLSEEKDDQKFKQFDIVNDCSDHFFCDQMGKDLASSQVKRAWLKKVNEEWSILKKSLPETIYVRAYEERMDLLRAVIVGAPGTPYHDGLYFFDVFLPPEYPNTPPMVHYHSGGLRLNPNLYESGKICLSLLNTWTGMGSEVWDPMNSTILQVLVSLQALVLNERPYFNEAGYDKQVGEPEGEKNSVSYNENAFLLSCKSMMYTLRKSPKHFEMLVLEHFGDRYKSILLSCKQYLEGAPVRSSPVRGIVEEQHGDHEGRSMGFKIMLMKLYPKLIEAFENKGFDCSQFSGPWSSLALEDGTIIEPSLLL